MNIKTLPRTPLLILMATVTAFALGCSRDRSFPYFWAFLNSPYFTGTITGTVLDENTGVPIEGASVKIDVRGVTFSATTASDGTFTLEAEEAKKKEGYNVNFTKANYDDLTRAVIFTKKNQPIDLGTLYMTDDVVGHVERSIAGRVLDNYGPDGLEGATVSAQNSHYETIVGVTGADGGFELTGYYFTPGSSYVVTVSKQDYITLSTVTVSITGDANTIDGNPVRLYRQYGDIIGTVEDDNTGDPLEGASVSVTDGRGATVTASTDGDGGFRLTGVDFYVGDTYNIAISKTSYFSGSAAAVIGSTGDNEITGGTVCLMINGSISGSVTDPDSNPLGGIAVQVKDGSGTLLASGATAANGTYSLASASFRKGETYGVFFSHAIYESTDTTTPAIIEGNNAVGAVVMQPKSFTGYTLTGVTADDWDSTKKLGASISIVDHDGVTRTATAGGTTGEFAVTGNFIGTETYTLKVSCSGYTGDTMVDRREVPVSVNGSSPQSLGQITLFPIGIRAYIASQKREFGSHIKQTHEKFLTGKAGFTLSARNGTDLNTASTFYLHTDDPEQPDAPDGEHTTAVAVNGGRVSGYLSAGIGDDLRTAAVGMEQYATYHFCLTSGGQVAIETFGSGDTYLLLYDENGTLIADSDDGGSGGNAKLTETLPAGWYFARVQGHNDDVYGFYELGVTGPVQDVNTTGTWNTADLILSWYNNADSTMYIAGAGEAGSAGSISITMMSRVGRICRGSFSGTLRAITQAGTTMAVEDGYFNVIRSE